MNREDLDQVLRYVAARRFYNRYQAIDTARQGQRPDPPTERGPEERYQFDDYDRLKALAINRNLIRSNSKALTIVGNRTVLAFGKVKARFASSDPEFNAAADEFFNTDFARDCRYDEPEHLIEVIQGIERCLMSEGDVLISFDDWLSDSGKLMIWEADQLGIIDPADWEAHAPNEYRKPDGTPFQQAHGIITTPDGRLAGYVCTRRELAADKAGTGVCSFDEVTLIPAGSARLVKNRFRFNQQRGVPSLLAVSDNLYDIDEMIKSELGTARLRSKIYAYVKHQEETLTPEQRDVADALLNRLNEATAGREPGEGEIVNGQPVPPAEGEVVKKIPEYETLAAFTGGLTDYLAPGDDLHFPELNRPNLDTATFFNALSDAAAGSQGLTQAFARMAVASSYTAHRGETAITYSHLKNAQKRMEYQLLDWLAVKVIRRAVRLGLVLSPEKDPRWIYKINWEFPQPDSIDPERQAKANAQKLKNGEITYSELLGPGWKKQLLEFAEELRFIREHEIPLNIFETAAGAASPTLETEENQ